MIESRTSGYASLEVFNALGQKVSTVFQGHLVAGIGRSIDVSLNTKGQTMLIYVLQMNGRRISGKLIHIE
jgi:hypothetical protein